MVTRISKFNKLACREGWIIYFRHALNRVAQQLPKLQQTLHSHLQSLEKGFLSIFSEMYFCSLLFSPSAWAAGAPQPADISHSFRLLYPTLRESPKHTPVAPQGTQQPPFHRRFHMTQCSSQDIENSNVLICSATLLKGT